MRGRLPADYTPPPLMDNVVAYYVKAFFQMSRSRPIHFGGPGHLNLSCISDYVAIYGEPYDMEEFIDVIFAMDGEYLPVAIKKQQQQAKSKPSKGERVPMLPPAKGR